MTGRAIGHVITEIADPATVRLISTAYIVEPALAPLCDGEDELRILERLEAMSSARLAPARIPPGVDPAELLTPSAGFGHSYVNAAFCYVKPAGNRFNDGTRGAWYAGIADGVAPGGATPGGATLTARAEVVFHLTRELDHVGIYDNVTACRELLAGIIGPFHDLGGAPDEPALSPDIDTAYPAGQRLARKILAEGGNGILYPSARRPGGRCLAAFRPHLIQNVRHGDTITFRWTGARTPTTTVGTTP